ncbi:MAG TPA: hypothetical protein ENH29_02490 [Bacteroidetes bacterium]|nr:hypothetical protein [Bacteroidota bacterium]
MNLSNIERLEEKINHIVQQMQTLKERNRELEQRNIEFSSMLEDRNRLIQANEAEIDHLKQQMQNSLQFQEQEERIKQKITQMLSKLDQLESMV